MAEKTKKTGDAQAKSAAEESLSIADAIGSGVVPKVRWDDSNMRTTFANVVNGSSTREEVTIFFGTNQTWNLGEETELKVNLSDRIILTPFAAKRLSVLLEAILKAYEARFGSLDLEGQIPSRKP